MAATLNKQANVLIKIPSSTSDEISVSSVTSKLKNSISTGYIEDDYYSYYWRYGNKYGNAVCFASDGSLKLTNIYTAPLRWYGRIKIGTHETTAIVWDTSSKYHYETSTTTPSYQDGSLFDISLTPYVNKDTISKVVELSAQQYLMPAANVGYEIQFYWMDSNNIPGSTWINRGISELTWVLSWYQDFNSSSNYENVVVYNSTGGTVFPSGVTITPTLYSTTWSVLKSLTESDRAAYKLSYPRDAGNGKKYADGNRTVIVKVTFTK
jgi:hypothetical protein